MGIVAIVIAAWAVAVYFRDRSTPAHDYEAAILRLYSGFAIVAAVVMGIGSLSLALSWYAVALVAAAAVLFALWRRYTKRVPMFSYVPERQSRFAALNLFVVLVAQLIAFIASRAPITSWDAATAHLALPAAYARDGSIGLVDGNVYSAYPQMLHSLFAVIYWVNGEWGVALFSWWMCAFSAMAVYALGKRVAGDEAGAVAAALFATSPIFAAQAGTVAIDVPFTGFIAAALTALFAWQQSTQRSYLMLAGVIAGAACGIRHTGHLVLVLMAMWVFIESKPARINHLVFFATTAALAAAPWWLRSSFFVGNPVYPVLTSVFGDGGMPDVQRVGLLEHETARNAGLLDFITFPWRILMHPDQFDGWQASPGGLTLALGVVGVLVGGRISRWLGAFSLAGVVTIYYVQRLARYLLPFFMPLHVLSGVAVARLQPLRRPLTALLAFSYIYGLALAAGMMHFKLPAVFGVESRDDYLTRRVERWPAFAWANTNLDPAATVLTLDPRDYFLRSPAYTNLAALAEIGREPESARLEWMQRHGIRYIFVPEAYVAASPVFRDWGIAPLVESWRTQPDRFVPIYDAAMADVRRGGDERVVIYEVVWGDASDDP